MTNDPPSRVLLLAPMRSELQPIVRLLALKRSSRGMESRGEPGSDGSGRVYTGRAGRTEVIATTIGVGPEAAGRTTERILSKFTVDHVIVCGIAGGVGPHREIGSMVVPDRVIDGNTRTEFRPDALEGVRPLGTILTVGELVVDHEAIDRLAAQGIVALDMESSAVGEVCGRLGYRWSVFRSISDNAGDGGVDDSVLGLLRQDGSVDVVAAMRLILMHPGRLPRLIRLAKDSSIAARAAARAAVDAISR